MPLYSVFGGVLETDITFPELRGAPSGPVTWSLRRGAGEAPTMDGVTVGTEELLPGVTATLTRLRFGFRLSFDDSGIFDLADGGGSVVWYPHEQSNHELARIDFLGRVLAVASHLRGSLCLHASAVVLDEGAIAFLAPKGFGKSTLALTLVSDGCRLLTDDTLPVDLTPAIRARPGVHTVRLFSDSARRFSSLGEARTSLSNKANFELLPDDWLMAQSCPLSAVYFLAPVAEVESGAATRRTQLSPLSAAIALIQHSKLGPLLGRNEAGIVLGFATQLADQVPAYTLEVTRDFDRLGEVARSLRSWHGRGSGVHDATPSTAS